MARRLVSAHDPQTAVRTTIAPTPSIVLAREISQKHMELGNLYRKLQRFDEAANEYLKASRVDPENFDARILLAKTHGQRGQMRQAQIELVGMLQIRRRARSPSPSPRRTRRMTARTPHP